MEVMAAEIAKLELVHSVPTTKGVLMPP